MAKLCLTSGLLAFLATIGSLAISTAAAEIPSPISSVPLPGLTLTPLAHDIFKDANLAIAAYKKGAEQIMGVIPDNISDRDNDLFPLSFIKREVFPITGWGHIQRDNQMIALSNGKIGGCWIMFYNHDHSNLEIPGPTLMTSRIDGLVTVVARPDRISEKWAGIFLVHELSHVYDELSGVSHPSGFSELVAYDLEMRAYNLLSKNKFTPLLDEIIHSKNLQTVAELATDIKNDSKHLRMIITKIESRLNEVPALSISERQMRDGFFVTSLAIRIGEKQHLDSKVMAQNLEHLLSQISLYK